MAETKLEKVNERLYHEPYKDGKPFKWEKRLCPLSLTLTDIRIELCLEIGRVGGSFGRLWDGEEPEDERKATQGNTTTMGEEKEDQKYIEHFGWYLKGTGRLKRSLIGLIKKDGTFTNPGDHLDPIFVHVNVTLRPVPPDRDKEKAYGSFFYDDGEDGLLEPGLYLDLLVPESRLEKLCNEILSGRVAGLEVGADVDVFEREVDRALRGPGMTQLCYTEDDIKGFNRAYLSRLVTSRSIGNGASGAPQVPDNPRELFATEGFSEQKVNFIGKRLLDIEDRFKSTLNELRNAIVVLAIVFLAWKVLAWLFR